MLVKIFKLVRKINRGKKTFCFCIFSADYLLEEFERNRESTQEASEIEKVHIVFCLLRASFFILNFQFLKEELKEMNLITERPIKSLEVILVQ